MLFRMLFRMLFPPPPPPSSWRPDKGDLVVFKGKLCPVIHVDKGTQPWSYTIITPAGTKIGTEIKYLTSGDGASRRGSTGVSTGKGLCGHAARRIRFGPSALRRHLWFAVLVLALATVTTTMVRALSSPQPLAF